VTYCVNCGKELTAGAVFCPYCGAAVTIEAAPVPTTAETRPSANFASLGQRIVAAIIDAIIVGIAVAVVSGVFMFSGLGMFGPPRMWHMFASPWVWAPWMWLVGLLIPVGYYTYLEGTSGQTIGKRIVNIKVVKADGSRCDMSSAFLRSILRIIDSLFIGIVGIIVISTTEKKQRIGDIVANTIVVKA